LKKRKDRTTEGGGRQWEGGATGKNDLAHGHPSLEKEGPGLRNLGAGTQIGKTKRTKTENPNPLLQRGARRRA